ncbi:DUF86 domain-containing protein [Rhizobium sp. S-51]|uniref:DUF86 domain-containing protein n=1 Tax=Rhizobium terricola TaxID=2728849 RepID=A0A7Y0ASW0_9HYPH|nr:HepT-like ribonuclease domain-containing protein [Rhizobium terricola]NML72862.1 DUF86 domain-containing protein [Rhizobium terricola]
MNREERIRSLLDRIRSASLDAHGFVTELELQDFRKNLLVQRGVGMSLLMASECVVQLEAFSPDFVAEHPEIPWAMIRGMRNRMAHGYFDIDLNYVFQTAKHEVPDLVRIVETLLHIHPQGE